MSYIMQNAAAFNSGLIRHEKEFNRKFAKRVKILVEQGMVRLLRRTPVHTGQAAMNYVASAGTPSGAGVKEGFPPVEATNRKSLGSEQLRPQAEAVSKATLANVSYEDPFQVFWIVNRSPNISGLEAGELPYAPKRQRSPNGMFGVTLQELLALIEGSTL